MADQREILREIRGREVPEERWKTWLITDFGVGDLAFGEVADRLFARNIGLSAEKLSVPPFSTISTGFVIAQIGLWGASYDGKIIYSNTAPRGSSDVVSWNKQTVAWEGDENQPLLFGILENGVPVLAIAAGYNWSFVKNHIAKDEEGLPLFYRINTGNKGYQFRSRDLYPDVLYRVLTRDETILGERLNPAMIPDYPRNQVVYIDGYGNVKIGTAVSEFNPVLKSHRELSVTLNGATKRVQNMLDGSSAEEGLILRAGSSSNPSDKFIELQLMNDKAIRVFEAHKRLEFKDGHNTVTFSLSDQH